MTPRRYRYPGTKPFGKEDADLFFGREEDIRRLAQLISIEKMVVLFSKSGMGKTSLLNAGIAPLVAKHGYKPVFVRFISSVGRVEADGQPLSDFFIEQIQDQEAPFEFLDELVPENNDLHLWYHFKKYQQKKGAKKTYLIIFDQFEELFTHAPDRIAEFMRDFSELYHTVVPQRFRDELVRKTQENPAFVREKEIQKVFEPINLKVVFSIRVDKLSELNNLTRFFPNIMTNAFELQPFGREQAEKAITLPARQLGNFDSLPFEFSDSSLEKVFKALLDREGKFVECFQLQIICQYITQQVNKKIQPSDGSQIVIVKPEDLGNLRLVYDNYYLSQINQLPQDEQIKARILLEEELILKNGLRHLRHEKDLETATGVTAELLALLENLHLVRKEVILGQTYYELSHDQFIKTLQRAKDDRKQEELRNEMQKEFEERRKRETLIKDFEEARQLDRIDRERIKLMRKETHRKQIRFFWNRIRREEKINNLKGFSLILGAITLLVFLVWATIYGFNTGKRHQNEHDAWLRQLNQSNEQFDRALKKGNGISPEESRLLLEQYRRLEKQTRE